jgi:hypothetical protein
VKETLKEKLGSLSIHGGVVGYYQGMTDATIGGMDFKNPDGAGITADLELSFKPMDNGEAFLRLHAGEGDGADKDLEPEGGLFADLNTLNDDNTGDEAVKLLEAFYTHKFFDDRLFVSIGKTEPLVFIDDNAFANDEKSQFVGKPFVANPMLCGEDEYAPLLALGVSPIEPLTLTVLVQSSSYPRLEEDRQKGKFDDIFTNPMVAGQLTYTVKMGELEGNYRAYGWSQTYGHPKIRGKGTDEGWGIGLSVDQMVYENIGLFARVGYHNDEVYEVPWFWSGGVHLQGIIPSRDEDTLGLGVAGLVANDDLNSEGTEYHLEAYYRIVLSEHMAISPDLQYVIDPLGDSDNDGVLAGMMRAELSF